MRSCLYAFTLALLAILSMRVSTEASEPFGTLKGTVRDSNGAIVPGATITVQRWSLDEHLKHVTAVRGPVLVDQAGQFTIDLEPGLYDIFVSYSSLAPFASQSKIQANKVTVLDCTLKFSRLIKYVE